MVWLLIALFSLINLSSTADIIHLKSGRQVEGRVIERGPDRVKIEATSDSGNKKISIPIELTTSKESKPF